MLTVDRFRATRRVEEYIGGNGSPARSIDPERLSSNINRVWTNIDLPPRRSRVAWRSFPRINHWSIINRRLEVYRSILHAFSFPFRFFRFFDFLEFSIRSKFRIFDRLRIPKILFRPLPRIDVFVIERKEYDKGIHVALDDEVPFLSNELKVYEVKPERGYPKASRRA